MTLPASRDWRVILLAVVGGAGALLCLSLAAATAGYKLVEPWLRPMTELQARSEGMTRVFVLAGGMVLIAGVLITTGLAARQSLRGRADASYESKPMRWWVVLFWMGVWLGASGLAQFLHHSETFTWAIPLLHLIAIASPIYVLVRLAIGGIQGGSRLRLWGSVTTGMLLGTGMAAAVEVLLLLAAVIAVGLYLIGNPQQVIALQHLGAQLALVAGPEDAITVLGPILTSPLSLAVALAAVAVATPLVEELAKSVPVWAQHDRISNGAQGFWAGAISGAGFALFEGIIVSADASESLAFILVLRAGSSLMHIVASSLSGWGIGVFRRTGKADRAVAGYAAAMLVHSLWNALIVAIGYGGILTTYGARQLNPVGLALSVGGAVMLTSLLGLLPVALLGLNFRFRRKNGAPSAAASASGTAHSAPGAANASEVS